VRFLVDENFSPQLCALLTGGSDTAEHVRDAVSPGATDQQILTYALDHAAVIVTADTDFGGLLARGRMNSMLDAVFPQKGSREVSDDRKDKRGS